MVIWCQVVSEICVPKLLKSDNWFSSYSQKCRGCFFGTQCIFDNNSKVYKLYIAMSSGILGSLAHFCAVLLNFIPWIMNLVLTWKPAMRYRRMTLTMAGHVLKLHVFVDDNVCDFFLRNPMTIFTIVLAIERHLQRTLFQVAKCHYTRCEYWSSQNSLPARHSNYHGHTKN